MNNIIPFSDVNLTSKDFLLLDTSFILRFLGYDTIIQKQPHNASSKNECTELIEKIANSEASFAISTITYTELSTILTRALFKQNQCPQENDIKTLKETNKEKYIDIIQQAHNDLNDYIRELKKLNGYYPEIVGNINSTLLERVYDIQANYLIHGLSDALQIAIALNEGFTHFVTVDKDFNNVQAENLTILSDTDTYNKTSS